MSNFNLVDIIILIIFASSILVGLARGLVSEIISLGTLIVAFIVAVTFTNSLATAMTNSGIVQSMISQTTSASGINTSTPASYVMLAISFALLFAGTLIVGAIFKSLINLAVQTGMIGIGNRILGGVFGFARGFIINMVLIFIVQLTPLSSESWWQQSYFVEQFQPAVVWLGQMVSPALANLKNTIGQGLQNATSSISSEMQGLTR